VAQPRDRRAALGFDDHQRAAIALKKIGGRRLTYRRTDLGSYLGA